MHKFLRATLFFFRLFIWFSFRNLRRHPGRALTVLLGIALGAAVFTSVRLSVHASLDSFGKSMELIYQREAFGSCFFRFIW
jgi:putative ABC transport system permease protein